MITKEEAQKIAEKEAIRDGCDFIRYLKKQDEFFCLFGWLQNATKNRTSSLLSSGSGMECQGLFRHEVFTVIQQHL